MYRAKKIMAVVGTRPDAIKMCPLINELKKREDMTVVVCATGQHRDLLGDVLDTFGVAPDYDLEIMKEGQSLTAITEKTLKGIDRVLDAERPSALLVHGDTTSAFAAALAAFYRRIPVCHVEAGLRTYDIRAPYPEEFNRRAIALVAAEHFAPTERARENLLSECVAEEKVSVTGNTVVDALNFTTRIGSDKYDGCEDGSRIILLTAHRRENQGERMGSVFTAVRRIADEYEDVRVIYPVHPSPTVRKIAEQMLGEHERITLCPPMGVLDFHNTLKRSYLVLTDSGGVQEEAAALGRPTLVIRNNTERGEGVASGGIRLVGTGEGSVYRGIRALLENKALYYAMSRAKNPFGQGDASRKIADVVENII